MIMNDDNSLSSPLELGAQVRELENSAAVTVTPSAPPELTLLCSLCSPALPPSAPKLFFLVTCQ